MAIVVTDVGLFVGDIDGGEIGAVTGDLVGLTVQPWGFTTQLCFVQHSHSVDER
jgi:hypothetical protein